MKMSRLMIIGTLALLVGQHTFGASQLGPVSTKTDYTATVAAPDVFTTTDGNKELLATKGTANPDRPGDKGKVRESNKNGATITFAGRTWGWGCLFRCEGYYVVRGGGGRISTEEAVRWWSEFDDANTPRIVLEIQTSAGMQIGGVAGIPQGPNTKSLKAYLFSGEIGVSYVVSLTSDHVERLTVPPTVTLTGPNDLKLLDITGANPGLVSVTGLCTSHPTVLVMGAMGEVYPGYVAVLYTPYSTVGVYIKDRLPNGVSMTGAIVPNMTVNSWSWIGYDFGFLDTNNPASANGNIGQTLSGAVTASNQNVKQAAGVWGDLKFVKLLDGPYFVTEYIKNGTPSTYYECENHGATPESVTLTKTVNLGWAATTTGAQDTTTGSLTTHQAGGSVEVSGKAWGIVQVTGSGHYDYTNVQKEEILTKTGFANNTTYSATYGESRTFTTPAHTRKWIDVASKIRCKVYNYNVYKDDNNDGAADAAPDTDVIEASVPLNTLKEIIDSVPITP